MSICETQYVRYWASEKNVSHHYTGHTSRPCAPIHTNVELMRSPRGNWNGLNSNCERKGRPDVLYGFEFSESAMQLHACAQQNTSCPLRTRNPHHSLSLTSTRQIWILPVRADWGALLQREGQINPGRTLNIGSRSGEGKREREFEARGEGVWVCAPPLELKFLAQPSVDPKMTRSTPLVV